MNQAVPPPIAPPTPQRKRWIRAVALVFLICCFAFAVSEIVTIGKIGASINRMVKDGTEIHFRSFEDKFQMTVLDVKSESNNFMIKVRVNCERDMEAGIWVADLKQAGIFPTTGSNGAVFYHEGRPYKAGSSAVVHANGKFSTCDVLFRVSTNSSSTIWHSEVAGDKVDTTLRTPLMISEVQTNWPASYPRGSELPLANLGDYKILLSVK